LQREKKEKKFETVFDGGYNSVHLEGFIFSFDVFLSFNIYNFFFGSTKKKKEIPKKIKIKK